MLQQLNFESLLELMRTKLDADDYVYHDHNESYVFYKTVKPLKIWRFKEYELNEKLKQYNKGELK